MVIWEKKERKHNSPLITLPSLAYNPGQKLWPKLRKTALYLTPQAMYNQFKTPSAGNVSELYYIYRKT